MRGDYTRRRRPVAPLAGLFALLCASIPQASVAVPSFARQTGLACEACHTVFPQLTPFGRVFKASGYTMFNTLKVADINRLKQSTLSLSDIPPISAMVMASSSFAAKPDDSQSSNTSTDFPQQLSLFYAGRIADNVGAFIQLTYDDQSGTVGIDNTDIRFADVATIDGHSVLYGVSLNNNPTVQDLWNTAPAWSQPFIGSPALMSPAGITQIEAPLAQVVAGVTGYAFVDQSFYGEAGVYRSALQGASVANGGNASNDIIAGVAPYWRLAYEHDWADNSWELGTLGLYTELQNPVTPAGNAINASLQNAPTDKFFDAGLDTEYEFINDDDQLTLDARWIHEVQHLDASHAAGLADNVSDKLDSASLVATYYWRRRFGGALGFFNLSGSNDPLYYGTFKGTSNSSWGMAEIDYVPWLNIKLGLQYTAYLKFNGATTNYDGAGRSASDNNLLYLYMWLAF